MCAYYDAGLPCGECLNLDSCGTCTEKGLLKGWMCPVCGRGVSPYVAVCLCGTTSLPPLTFHLAPYKPWDYTVTCGGSTCGL